MSYGGSRDRYLENEVLSRPREWLVPLLYEHLLSSLRRAGVQMDLGDYEGKGKSLGKANAIVLELAASLDGEQGGDLAKNLSGLYAFFVTEIRGISRTMDTRRLHRLVGIIAELHEAWVGAAEQLAPRSAGRPLAAQGA
jgi:flagellar secretion chaperone FliS